MRVAEGAKAQHGVVQSTGRPPKPVTGRSPGNNQPMPAPRAPEAALAASSALYSSLLWQATGHVQQAPVNVDRAMHFPGLYVSYQLKQLPADAYWEAEPAPAGGKRMRLPNHHNRQRCKDATPPDSPLSWQSGGRGAGHFSQQQQQHQQQQQQAPHQQEAGGECSYPAADWVDPYPLPSWGAGCKQSARSKRRPCSDPLRYRRALGDDEAAAEALVLQQREQQQQQPAEPPDPAGQQLELEEEQQPAPLAAVSTAVDVDVDMEDAGGSAPSTPSPASSQQPVQAMLGGSRDRGGMMALLAEAVGEGGLPGVPAAVVATPMDVELPPVPLADPSGVEPCVPSCSSLEQPQKVVAVVAALAVAADEGVPSEALWQKQQAAAEGAPAAGKGAAGANLDSPRGTSSESDLTCHLRSPESPESDKEGNSSPPLASPAGAAAAAAGVGAGSVPKQQEGPGQLLEAEPSAPQ